MKINCECALLRRQNRVSTKVSTPFQLPDSTVSDSSSTEGNFTHGVSLLDEESSEIYSLL